ncbi:MAG: YidC/Oxa1 family rane protein insertase [Solirubrobacteraceae bacterium]|nr:YidC/Oxa1 family rane protein insertase [Solirubrobacteraceae bacterium]
MAPFVAANVIQDAFSPLISVFKAIMVFLHDNVTGGSWGLAIIGLTIVVRAALVPLTVKQFSSMAKLQALGPDIKALQARHKDDKQRLNEEMMKFYKENQVNPFGSCLPLVLQLPVFLSLFYMLRSDLKVQICGPALHAHHIVSSAMIQKASCESVAPGSGKFLFIPDVTASAKGGVLIILIVLYIGSQLISSLMTTATVDRNQRLIALGLPFVFTIFIISFPAGLILYWITTNLWTVGQQYVVRTYFPPANLAGAGASAGTLGLSSLFSRGEPKEPKADAGGAGPRPRGAAAAAAAARAGKGGATEPAATKALPGKKTGAGRNASAAKGGPAEKTAAGTKTPPGVKKTPPGGKNAARAKNVPAGKSGTAAAKAPAGTSRRDRDAGSAANGRGAGADDVEATGTGRGAKAGSTSPRPRGAAPPPPPRKKKKRSGRRR